ncbi:MAG: hypothetical protein MUC28_01555 [Planctomycetes bacterium]|nr:hypothetical protein [Planctomycetota bacterium]
MIDFVSIDLEKEIPILLENDPGKQRGGDFIYLNNYVKTKYGEEGIRRVTAEIRKANYIPRDVTSIDEMDWIPSSLPTIFMLASAKIFHWRENDVLALGQGAISLHSLIKVFIRYFSSVKKTFQLAARTWQKHYSFGQLKIERFDEKNKEIILRLAGFKKHPISCLYLRGLFAKIIEVATGSAAVESEETKCEFKGDPYHEFVFRWR